MNNKPTLFVNSITMNENGKENQNIYDSRRNVKGKIFHRIDDILGFISLGRKVFVLINFANKTFYGEVVGLNNNYIFLKNDETVISLLVSNILEIRITSTYK